MGSNAPAATVKTTSSSLNPLIIGRFSDSDSQRFRIARVQIEAHLQHIMIMGMAGRRGKDIGSGDRVHVDIVQTYRTCA